MRLTRRVNAFLELFPEPVFVGDLFRCFLSILFFPLSEEGKPRILLLSLRRGGQVLGDEFLHDLYRVEPFAPGDGDVAVVPRAMGIADLAVATPRVRRKNT